MIITNIHDLWGSTINLANPLDFFSYSNEYWSNLLYERKILIFKKMTFNSALEFGKFSSYFGNTWTANEYIYSREKSINVGEFVITEFSNKIQQYIKNREMAYHADIPNRTEDPFPHRALWIVKNPNNIISGHTYWLNIENGIDYLNPRLSELLPRVTVKQQSWYNIGTDEKMFDLIKVHPVTGKQSLRLNYYVNKADRSTLNAWIKEVYIDGQLQPDCSLIQEYIDDLSQYDELFYKHVWDTYDIAIYDNYSFIHGRTALVLGTTPEDDERMFYRININHVKK